MREDRRGDLLAYRFEALGDDGVDCLVSTRLGGVSREPYASLNVGLGVGDDEEAVLTNRRRLLQAFGLDHERSVWGEQVHGDRVVAVAEADAGRGALDRASAVPAADALVTDVPGLPLCVTVADCVPLAVYDPLNRAVGLAHAGWKGTTAKIALRTVEAMRRAFGSEPAALRAAIGPSIGPQSYEVGSEVVDRVRDSFGAGAGELLAPRPGGRALLDLWQANRLALLEAGLALANVEVAGVSTADRLDSFYSHRAEGPTGRFCAVIAVAGAGR